MKCNCPSCMRLGPDFCPQCGALVVGPSHECLAERLAEVSVWRGIVKAANYGSAS